jgi:hypothetical protein
MKKAKDDRRKVVYVRVPPKTYSQLLRLVGLQMERGHDATIQDVVIGLIEGAASARLPKPRAQT